MRVALFIMTIALTLGVGIFVVTQAYAALFPLPKFAEELKEAAATVGADYWSIDQIVEDCTTEPAKWMAYVKDKSKQHIIRKYSHTPEGAVAAAIGAIEAGEWERLCTTTTLKSYSSLQ